VFCCVSGSLLQSMNLYSVGRAHDEGTVYFCPIL
jgi:hypothetical protein